MFFHIHPGPIQGLLRAPTNYPSLHIQLSEQPEKQQGNLKPESLLRQALLL